MSLIVEPSIIKVKGLLSSKNNLQIPSYQRPYSWGEKNVKQLLDDLTFAMNKAQVEYRLGNLIIHKNDKDDLSIVDGQQRLTTLSIILYILGNEDSQLLKSSYDSPLSIETIIKNKAIIIALLANKNEQYKTKLKDFILENCEFVYIQLDDLSEAFQLFDSQNSRGKPLEAYDLLKAFHLREMDGDSDEDKQNCVTKWEKYVDNGKISHILGTNLFRIRRWARGESGEYFSKDNIEEFKGININQHKDFPYLKPYLMNIGFTEEFGNNKLFKTLNLDVDFPFQINQIIINGKYFFKYVYYYSELYDRLFFNNNSNFLDFYKKYTAYGGSWRQGDVYVKELYVAVILFYYDKFGEVGFEEAYKYLYKWSYALRLKSYSVRYKSIDAYVRADSKFKTIKLSYYPYEVMQKTMEKPSTIEREIKEIISIFN